ncbi:hypothetical protein TVAG_210370 [Trichomonas vaginalis G3]|uniref:Uncharacterized protein n=1 Tax=Trichomonas vaginalis (strain ATCC PRA-98 / G3) TaxID=412133 RepID=A2DVU4_TRIV3|nr:hypothetical protein TVAGG3_0734930 [Trichomonas vaginalis G3]EAY15507.1 hypothetical protein TVAG_210370 [Trichomonas vaginalis G3]KAI5511518.1 hypothetical protein TVAGG3_0734930 [Trichomonas vaginalis G3]|eukprot:XP_001327730.1 hypothetical protein [Trichomonas vaginalis G3]
MTYFSVDENYAQTVPGLQSVLQFAEMLEKTCPTISVAFANYGAMLIDEYMISIGVQDPDGLAARNIIRGKINGKPCADAETLDSFGSKILIAAETSQNKIDLIKLAYIAFSATSAYGAMKQSTQARLNRCVQILTDFSSQEGADYPDAGGDIDIPSGTPGGAGVPPNPWDAPGASKYYQTTPEPAPEPEPTASDDPKCMKLAQIAQQAFKEGAYDIAITAIMACIKDLDSK